MNKKDYYINELEKEKELLKRIKKLDSKKLLSLLLAASLTVSITTLNKSKANNETEEYSKYIVLEDGSKLYKGVGKEEVINNKEVIINNINKEKYNIPAKDYRASMYYPVLFEGDEKPKNIDYYNNLFKVISNTYNLSNIVTTHDGRNTTMLDVVCAIIVAESYGAGYAFKDINGNSYEKGAAYTDCYAGASLLFKRIQDSVWIYSTEKEYGKDTGQNLYYQAILKNQFEVYFKNQAYLDYLGRIDLPGYQAVLDMLYCGEASINFQEFRGWWVDKNNTNYVVAGGNRYLKPFDEENHVDLPFELPIDNEENNNYTLKSS